MKKLLFSMCVIIAINANAQSLKSVHTFHFNSGKSDIAPGDKSWLDSICTILKTAASYSISIKGYCDADGSDENNTALATAREISVKELFLNNKLDNSMITSVAFGEKDPVADNATTEGKAKNRRTEVVVNYQLVSKKTEEKPVAKVETAPENKKPVVINEPGKAVTDLSSVKLEAGKTLILKKMNFVGGSDVLLPESQPTLEELAKIMKENPTMVIEIGGHVCCGPDMDLSVLRAKKVYAYLRDYGGINVKRMSYKGYSFDKPIASERTEEGRTANRRVEITILKM